MKPSTCTPTLHCFCATLLFVAMALTGCSEKELTIRSDRRLHRFVSAEYNHFEGGVLFTDVTKGLDVLWKASFTNGHVLFKENLAFFVPTGLLILPNAENTQRSARLSALEKYLEDGKLFVRFEGQLLQVLGIIHTHPDIYSLHEPASRNDYSYCYLGIHSYVMDHHYLMDAYLDRFGRETFKVIGQRTVYKRMPFEIITEGPSISLAIGSSVYKTSSYNLDSVSLRNAVSIK